MIKRDKMKKIKLTKETKKHWFHAKAYNNEPILNKHHIIPRHHGGVDEPHNMTPPLTLMEHAEMHLDIHKNGIEGVKGTKGCKECLKNYKTLKGQHEKFKILAELYKGDVDTIEFYRYENKEPNVLDEIWEVTIGDEKEHIDTWDVPQTIGYEAGVHENTEFEKPEHEMMKDSLNEEVTCVLDTLSERERIVLEMFFGINRDNPLTLNEIAEEFDLIRERVRQIKEKAIERLQHRSRSQPLKWYV